VPDYSTAWLVARGAGGRCWMGKTTHHKSRLNPVSGARSIKIGSVALRGQEVGLDTVYEQDSAAHRVRDGTGAWRAAALRIGLHKRVRTPLLLPDVVIVDGGRARDAPVAPLSCLLSSSSPHLPRLHGNLQTPSTGATRCMTYTHCVGRQSF
jgi:hypothetical protein